MDGQPKVRWRRLVLWTAGVCVAVTAAVVISGWLMFQSVPSWYRPVQVAPADIQRVKDDLMGTLDVFNVQMIRAEQPFELRLTQDQLNAWIEVREDMWTRSRDWLPPFLSDPFVAIEEDGLRVAATYTRGQLRTVVSARFVVEAAEDGVFVQLAEVQTGVLPVPLSWIEEELGKINLDRIGRQLETQAAKWLYGPQVWPDFSQITQGIVVPGAWIWWNGRRPFRIVKMTYEPGAVVVTCRPLAPQPRGESIPTRPAPPMAPPVQTPP